MKFEKTDYLNQSGKQTLVTVPKDPFIKLLSQALYMQCVKSWAIAEHTLIEANRMDDFELVATFCFTTPDFWQFVAVFGYDLTMAALRQYVRDGYAGLEKIDDK
jgi:hypothetical protein